MLDGLHSGRTLTEQYNRLLRLEGTETIIIFQAIASTHSTKGEESSKSNPEPLVGCDVDAGDQTLDSYADLGSSHSRDTGYDGPVENDTFGGVMDDGTGTIVLEEKIEGKLTLEGKKLDGAMDCNAKLWIKDTGLSPLY